MFLLGSAFYCGTFTPHAFVLEILSQKKFMCSNLMRSPRMGLYALHDFWDGHNMKRNSQPNIQYTFTLVLGEHIDCEFIVLDP